MRWLLALLSLVALAACAHHGSTTVERRVEPDGTTIERFTYISPDNSRDDSGVTVEFLDSIKMSSTFSGAHKPEAKKSEVGQWIFYGGGAICTIIFLVFIYKMHFKLAALAALGTGVFVGLAIAIDVYPFAILCGVGILVLAILFYIGLQLWRDYQDDQTFNNSQAV